jgi:secondary thiamine-phosphate synthase enzyme
MTRTPNPTGSVVRVRTLRTKRRTDLQDVTQMIAAAVRESGCVSGICHLYVPHTTAGVIVNEDYDPAVAHDIEAAFDRLVPRVANSAHAEANSDSHIKTALVGSSETIWIADGKLALGRW